VSQRQNRAEGRDFFEDATLIAHWEAKIDPWSAVFR
jgi:hypothetical protein